MDGAEFVPQWRWRWRWRYQWRGPTVVEGTTDHSHLRPVPKSAGRSAELPNNNHSSSGGGGGRGGAWLSRRRWEEEGHRRHGDNYNPNRNAPHRSHPSQRRPQGTGQSVLDRTRLSVNPKEQPAAEQLSAMVKNGRLGGSRHWNGIVTIASTSTSLG
jgi:hypothetical protein